MGWGEYAGARCEFPFLPYICGVGRQVLQSYRAVKVVVALAVVGVGIHSATYLKLLL